MIRRLYNLLFPFAFLLMLPGVLRRMVRRGNYRRNFGQRLGWYAADVIDRLAKGPPRPWVQAVSVGEMLIALKLIAALRRESPGLEIVLSTTTTTGYQLAAERAGAGVEIVYTPIDFLPAVRRTLAILRPSEILIVEGGLWPNLLWESRRRGVRTTLVSARLSPRSERRLRRFLPVAAPLLFRALDRVFVSEQTDAPRWQSLGVPAERIVWTGNIKFDDQEDESAAAADRARKTAPLRAVLRALGVDDRSPILLAGSTHPGEEAILGRCFQGLRAAFPDLFLIAAPRHVERAAQARADLEALGLRTARLTHARQTPSFAGPAPAPAAPDNDDPPHDAPPRPDALLLDTTGELRDWYGLATSVFIGKSLVEPGGGQNPAEALAAGRAVIFGPRMDNFGDLVERLLAAGGAVQVPDAEGLIEQTARLLRDEARRAELARRGQGLLAMHRGAAERTVRALRRP